MLNLRRIYIHFFLVTMLMSQAFSIEAVTGYDGISFFATYDELISKGFKPIFTDSTYIHKQLQSVAQRGVKLSPEILADTNQYDSTRKIALYNDTTLLNLAIAELIQNPKNILLDSILQEEIAEQDKIVNNADSTESPLKTPL